MKPDPIRLRNEKLGKTVCQALEARGFTACWCPSKKEALEKALEWVPSHAAVSWGGCASAEQCGILDALRQGPYTLWDRDTAQTPEERTALMRQAFFSDYYITGTNALSEDGQLFNVDGNGNRVAAMAFGPAHVLVVVGINKVVKTEQDAWNCARTVAAPINAQRFGLNTPCSVTGSCGDCQSPDCICNVLTVTRRCKPAGRIQVLLVGEPLGF